MRQLGIINRTTLRPRAWLLWPLTFALVLLVSAASGVTRVPPVAVGPATLAAVATPTPTASPAGGWWATVSLTPAPLPGLPGLPALGSMGGSGASSNPTPVAFTPLACAGGQITRIVTGDPGWWNVYGAATAANLDYWKMELSADGQHWTLLYRQNAPVQDGKLMAFNIRTVPRGVYQLRLLIVDRTGNYTDPCTIQIATN